MDLPAVEVTNLVALQDLALVEDPREMVVGAIDAVRNAPEYLVLVAQKTEIGWTCGQERSIRKVARFAELLFEAGNVIIPALEKDASSGEMVLRLGSHGRKIRDLGSRSKPHTPSAVVRLARPIGKTLRETSRPVIKGEQSPAWLAERLVLIAAGIETCLDSYVDMEALRTVRVASLVDLRDIGGDVDGPHHIRLIAVDAVRNAPECLDLVLQKTGVGWKCDQEARLRRVARFAELLAEISEVIIPALKLNVERKASIRRLRTRGEKILRVKSRAPAQVVALAGPLGNRIAAAARSVLTGANKPAWLADRLDDIAAQVHECLDSHIDMEDDESEDEEPHHLPPPPPPPDEEM